MLRSFALTLCFTIFAGCTSHTALIIEPTDQVTVEIPSGMYSSIKMSDGEILFLQDGELAGFIMSDPIPESELGDSDAPSEQILYDSAAQGSEKPQWIPGIVGAKGFWVTRDRFSTVFVIEEGDPDILTTLQAPTDHLESIRINGATPAGGKK